jgi:predicted flap endonuclease-1-like 5' DNA nuclease
VNGLTLLLVLAMVVGIAVAWRAGVVQGRRTSARPTSSPHGASDTDLRPNAIPASTAENHALRQALADADAMRYQATQFAEDRQRLFRDLAAARAETARYRDLCIGLENNAPPPLLDGPNAPDDLKLIVGIGPVLERMLHQLGVSTYRQIARWSERDIDEFDARLPEFPGRIRRDAWVTQARELHQSKFGETLPMRER